MRNYLQQFTDPAVPRSESLTLSDVEDEDQDRFLCASLHDSLWTENPENRAQAQAGIFEHPYFRSAQVDPFREQLGLVRNRAEAALEGIDLLPSARPNHLQVWQCKEGLLVCPPSEHQVLDLFDVERACRYGCKTTDYLGTVTYYSMGQRTHLIEYFTVFAGSAQVGVILQTFQSAQSTLRRKARVLFLDDREIGLLSRFFSCEKVEELRVFNPSESSASVVLVLALFDELFYKCGMADSNGWGQLRETRACEIFSPELLFTLRAFFAHREGFNIRGRVAHGLMAPDPSASWAWYARCLLVVACSEALVRGKLRSRSIGNLEFPASLRPLLQRHPLGELKFHLPMVSRAPVLGFAFVSEFMNLNAKPYTCLLFLLTTFERLLRLVQEGMLGGSKSFKNLDGTPSVIADFDPLSQLQKRLSDTRLDGLAIYLEAIKWVIKLRDRSMHMTIDPLAGGEGPFTITLLCIFSLTFLLVKPSTDDSEWREESGLKKMKESFVQLPKLYKQQLLEEVQSALLRLAQKVSLIESAMNVIPNLTIHGDLITEKSVGLAKSIIESLVSASLAPDDIKIVSTFAFVLISALNDPSPTLQPADFLKQLRLIHNQIGEKPRQSWGQKWRQTLNGFSTWLSTSLQAGATTDR